MKGARFAIVLGVITLAGFAWRAGYILVVTRHQPRPDLPMNASAAHPPKATVRRTFDELYYASAAALITEGRGFTTPVFKDGREDAVHPPLTQVVLAPVAWVSGRKQLPMRFTMAVAGAGVIALIGLIGREVAGSRAGLMAAGLAAVYPNLWMHDALIMSESFSALTTAAALLCTYRLVRRPSRTLAVATGVTCGLAALTRSELTLLVPLVAVPAVWVAARGLSRRRRLVTVSVVVFAAVVTIGPWVGYNLSRFEKPVLISYGEGPTLQGANCDSTYNGPAIGYWDGFCARVLQPTEPSVDAAIQRRKALRYMANHAGRIPLVVAARLGRVWGVFKPFEMLNQYQLEGKPRWASFPGWIMYWALMPFAFFGALTLRRRDVTLVPLLGVVLIVTLVAGVFYGLLRNRVPAEVVLVVLAAVGIDAFMTRVGWAGAAVPADADRQPSATNPALVSSQGSGGSSQGPGAQ